MPSGDYVHNALTASWRMMWGRHEAVRMHDLSADGFWTSFFAIVVALPALIVGWVGIAGELAAFPASFASRFAVVLRLAVVDISAWVLPLVLLAVVAPYAGIRDRFVHYVVAANWGGAIYVWILLPPALIRLFVSEPTDLVTLLAVALFFFTLVLSWRLTNAAIDKGPGMATAVFAGMLTASLVTLFSLQGILGLVPN
jgi:hypothetical protein